MTGVNPVNAVYGTLIAKRNGADITYTQPNTFRTLHAQADNGIRVYSDLSTTVDEMYPTAIYENEVWTQSVGLS